MPLTIQEVMQHMPERLIPEQAQGVTANIQFDFSLDGGGCYAVSIHDGRCEVHEGRIDQPDATLLTSQATYIAIAEGRTNAMNAFMTGQLRVSGNLPLMLKMQTMFDPTRPNS